MTQVRKQKPPATPKLAAAYRGPVDEALDPTLFKALADPTRKSLIACIAKCGRGCTVSEVAECCSVDLSVVSRHLALLARSGVLDVSRHGRTTYYRVRYVDLSRALRSLADALDACIPKTAAKQGACGHGKCC